MTVQVQAEIVADDELPDGVDRVIVERPGKCPLYLIRESATPPVFAWTEDHWDEAI
jgi:hypothetical protein